MSSAFGTADKRRVRAKEKVVAGKLALMDVNQDHTVGPADEMCLSSQRFSDAVALRSGNELCDQVQFIRRVRQAQLREAKEREEGLRNQVAAIVRKPPLFGTGEQRQSIPNSDFEAVRTEGDHCLVVSLNAKRFSTAKLATFACGGRKKDTVGIGTKRGYFLELWKLRHALHSEESLERLPEVHRSFRPSLCFTFGYGRCLCSKTGRLLDAARRRLGSSLSKLAPKASEARKQLLAGWWILECQGHFMHLSIHYFRPQRPTFLRCQVPEELFWGRQVIKPMFKANRRPDALIDLAFLEGLELTEGATFALHTLFSTRASPKRIGTHLRGSVLKAWNPTLRISRTRFIGGEVRRSRSSFWRTS